MATHYVTIHRDEVTSTQDLALAELRRIGRPVLIVANEQTAGRGRRGNDWWQAPRGVAASLAFQDGMMPVADTFSLAVGLAVRSAIAQQASVTVTLKWPNDVELEGDKVGGILVEKHHQSTVVGCGLNLWWPDPPAGVGSIAITEPAMDLGSRISQSWANYLIATAAHWDRLAYCRTCSTLGLEIAWDPAGRGRAIDIDDRGGLVVATASGEVTLRSGEVRAVRPAP